MPVAPGSSDGDARDNESWITVTAKRGRKRGHGAADRCVSFRGPSGSPDVETSNEPVSGAASTPVTGGDGNVPAYIESEHSRVVTWWRGQPSYASLGGLVQKHAPRHATVTRAVCLGAGSFGGPLDFGESIRRAHIQTEAFLLIVTTLSVFEVLFMLLALRATS